MKDIGILCNMCF